MPNLREASLAVAGRIINVERTTERGTNKYTGLRCLVATGDGFTQTRLNPEAAELVQPEPGQTVLWFVRPGAFQSDDGGLIFFTAFVREGTESDVDLIASSSKVLQKA